MIAGGRQKSISISAFSILPRWLPLSFFQADEWAFKSPWMKNGSSDTLLTIKKMGYLALWKLDETQQVRS